MRLIVENQTPCTLVRLFGDVTLGELPALTGGLRKAFAAETDCVVCDLGELQALDARCALAFVTVNDEQLPPAPTLFLTGATGPVLQVLQSVGVHRTLRLVDSLAEALAATPRRPPRLRELFLGEGDALDASRARRFTADVCARWGLAEVEPTMTLVVSELVTNVHRHAATSFELFLEWKSDWLRAAVRDWGPGLDRWPNPPSDLLIEGGEGLQIVAALSDAHGVGRHPGGGNVVWAGIPAPGTVRTHEPLPGPSVRAERTLRTGPSGSWESTLALTWDPRQPQVVEIAVLAEPPHPALPSGRWLLRREILATGVSQPVAADGVRIAPLPEDDHVRLELDAVASCALPISWVDAFLRRTTDRAPDLTVTPPVA